MDAQGIEHAIADAFGRGVAVSRNAQWVQLPCPLAPWTHERGHDRRPSAGVSIQPNGTSIFHCYSCHSKLPFFGMLERYAAFAKRNDLGRLIEEIKDGEYLGPAEAPHWQELQDDMGGDPPLDQVLYMGLYEPAAGHPYLVRRGLSDETADSLQLMADPQDPVDGEERIIFPIFGLDGNLYGFSGRATNDDAVLKVRDYAGFRKSHHLLGAHFFSPEADPLPYVVVVEGLVDYARSWQAGYPTLASMHSALTNSQLSILKSIGLPVYFMMDDDEAGRDGAHKAALALRDYVPTHVCDYPDVYVVNHKGEEERVKDPGAMPPEYFEEMIRAARLY